MAFGSLDLTRWFLVGLESRKLRTMSERFYKAWFFIYIIPWMKHKFSYMLGKLHPSLKAHFEIGIHGQ